jgi:hypothetical protein
VQLSQSKKLQDLLWLWSKFVDTPNSDNESNLWLSFNEERSFSFSISFGLDEGIISSLIFFEIFLSVGVSCLS